MVWFLEKTETNWTELFLKFIITEPYWTVCLSNRTVKVVRFYGFKSNHNQLFTKANQTIIENRTEPNWKSWIELFQYGFKTISYGLVFFDSVQFSGSVFCFFFCLPLVSIGRWCFTFNHYLMWDLICESLCHDTRLTNNTTCSLLIC
jgi:hypothetical protein